MVLRKQILTAVLVTALTSTVDAAASSQAWAVVKKGRTAGAGELALVGAIVRHPNRVAVRVIVSKPRTIAISVVVSCRSGLKTGIGRGRLTGRAPYTKVVSLPIAGADNCAVSATGTNAAGTLKLVLLRSS